MSVCFYISLFLSIIKLDLILARCVLEKPNVVKSNYICRGIFEFGQYWVAQLWGHWAESVYSWVFDKVGKLHSELVSSVLVVGPRPI